VPARLPVLSVAEEAEILSGVRAGGAARRAATDRLYRQVREPIHAMCLHLTGRRAVAEAAVEEAFAAVHRGLPDYRGPSRLTSWAYRIALRAAIRARARRPEAEPIGDPLGRLPVGPRAVLSLFAVEGLSHHEIAEILGVPEAAVWPRLRAARRMRMDLPGRQGGPE
jgi:RNA polymerase sigma-70 factor (ECF subfamily)